MQNQQLQISELISKVKEELKKVQYPDERITMFIPTWNQLKSYLEHKEQLILDAKTGLDFLETVHGITVFNKLPRKMVVQARAVNLLTDYQIHGIILSKTKRKTHTYHPQFQDIFQGYIDFKRHKAISQDTLQSYAIYLDRFSDYINCETNINSFLLT